MSEIIYNLAIIIYNLAIFIEESPVLSSVFSGIFIAISFSIIYPRYLNWLSRAKLKFIFPFDKKKFIELKEIPGAAGPQFEIGIENNSIKSVNLAYWHIFIKSEKAPLFRYNLEEYNVDTNNHPTGSGSVKPKMETIKNGWLHFSGIVEGPMFPGRKIAFPYDIRWEINSPGEYNMYYYFVTELGISPRKARKFRLENQMNKINKYLDKITLKIK